MATKVPNPVDKYVGSRVRMRRQMLGMSQGKLADKLRLTFQQVQKYEKGTNRISASRLQEMSCILQVPVPFFFEGARRSRAASGRTQRLRGPPTSLTFWQTPTD
jgi:transcriptional regulator with XRE-family HTH domain